MEEFDKERMHDLLIDYSERNLTGELKLYVEKYLEKNEAARKELEELIRLNQVISNSKDFEPDTTLKSEFEKAIHEEIESVSSTQPGQGKVITMPVNWVLRIVAGVAILAIGYFLGTQLSNSNELAELRKEMETTRQLVMGALQNQSPSQRIMGVTFAEDMKQPDDQILDVLIRTMNEDENVNVRLAALNALSKFSSSEKVKLAMIESLETQSEPLILISLIDALVNINETRAVDNLRDLAHDDNRIKSVQDQAQYGLFKLM